MKLLTRYLLATKENANSVAYHLTIMLSLIPLFCRNVSPVGSLHSVLFRWLLHIAVLSPENLRNPVKSLLWNLACGISYLERLDVMNSPSRRSVQYTTCIDIVTMRVPVSFNDLFFYTFFSFLGVFIGFCTISGHC